MELQYSVALASAFLALVYSDYMLTTGTKSLCCDGDLYDPKDQHHFAVTEGCHDPKDDESSCCNGFKWLNSTNPNPNVMTGALVGGPFLNDTCNDSRNSTMQCELTNYNGALLLSLFQDSLPLLL